MKVKAVGLAVGLLVSAPAWGQEEPLLPGPLLWGDDVVPAPGWEATSNLRARCVHEEGVYFGRRLQWVEFPHVPAGRVGDLPKEALCNERHGNIFEFELEGMARLAEISAWIVEHCPREWLKYPKAWTAIEGGFEQAGSDALLLEATERQLADWETLCGG